MFAIYSLIIPEMLLPVYVTCITFPETYVNCIYTEILQKVKVNFALEQAKNTQKGSRWWWMFNATLRPL
jgi:hypothetical protein